MDRVRILGSAPAERMYGGYCSTGTEEAYLKRPYEIFSDRNGTLRDDGHSAPIVSANAACKSGAATSGDATPAKGATPAQRKHPQ